GADAPPVRQIDVSIRRDAHGVSARGRGGKFDATPRDKSRAAARRRRKTRIRVAQEVTMKQLMPAYPARSARPRSAGRRDTSFRDEHSFPKREELVSRAVGAPGGSRG